MTWKKLGRIFCPDGRQPWMASHASNPVAESLEDDLFRVYFSGRDTQNRSSLGFVEFDIQKPQTVLKVCASPVLVPGSRGLFDDSGISMGSLVEHEGSRYLYYLGWNLGVTVPWRNSVGLAISRAGSAFQRVSPAPILDRNAVDPYSLSYPWVIKQGARWNMWYGSHLDWGIKHAEMRHVIKYASSSDGIHWERNGSVAIGLETPEWGVSRPCVIQDGPVFKMWFAKRGDSYQIGFAQSHDGMHWVRQEGHGNVFPSSEGWDSEAVCYPHVFDHRGRRYMLYCGNGFGKSGFGLAVQEQE